MDGIHDISNLFGRVAALEQEEADSDRTVTRIAKIYSTLGIKVNISAKVHQYRIAGDVNPIYVATCSLGSFI